MEEGFVKADSDNLPQVDLEMIHSFYMNNTDFLSSEIRNVKTKRASRESYGDDSVGYVQLRREGSLCTVKAKISPEHRLRHKQYNVIAEIDEAEETVVLCKCNDCAASEGGCKHGVAFLYWLHRRSEEPSVTSVKCYWKGSELSKVARGDQPMRLCDLVDKEIPPLEEKNGDFIRLIRQQVVGEGGIFSTFKEQLLMQLSMHQFGVQYNMQVQKSQQNAEDFISYLAHQMSVENCKLAEFSSRLQSESAEWHELRYGRITASKVYEVSQSWQKYESTSQGQLSESLIESILGAAAPFSTAATVRGKNLEKSVLKRVADMKNITVQPAGIFLKKEYPIHGASPDGISDDYVIEIKCPSRKKTVGNYIQEGNIKTKFLAQINMQMLFCDKKKGLFCVAFPEFESNQEVAIYETVLNTKFCENLLINSQNFWKIAIFPELIK